MGKDCKCSRHFTFKCRHFSQKNEVMRSKKPLKFTIGNLFKITFLIEVISSTIQSNYIDRLELIAIIKQ